MDRPSAKPRIKPHLILGSGLAWWLIALVLSLLQATREQVRWATPYGLTFLRTLIIPIVTIWVFYLLAYMRHKRGSQTRAVPSRWSQIFLLLLVLVLTYWAAIAPLRYNWLLLLGVWWLLPSLYLADTSIINATTLISLSSLILTLILIEILLQPFPQFWPGYARMVGSNWRRIHADIPSLEYEAKGISYRINRLGFRGEDPVPEQVEVIALGDSNTFGVGTQNPWPARLSESLQAPVLNLGMGGTDPPKHLNPLLAYGLPRDPGFAIEAYFEGNDLFTCYQPAYPQGPRWGDNLVLPDLIAGIKEMIRFISRDDAITSELTYDIATPFVRTLGGQVVELTFSPAYAATLLLDRTTIEGSENWRIASGAIRRMAEASQEKGATFVLIYLPERTHIYWPLIREDPELLAQLNQDMTYAWEQSLGCLTLVRGRTPEKIDLFRSHMDATLHAQRDLLQAFAQENEIPFLDLTPMLERLAQQGLTLADPLETHYNDFVHSIMAEEIASFLETLNR